MSRRSCIWRDKILQHLSHHTHHPKSNHLRKISVPFKQVNPEISTTLRLLVANEIKKNKKDVIISRPMKTEKFDRIDKYLKKVFK